MYQYAAYKKTPENTKNVVKHGPRESLEDGFGTVRIFVYY